MQMIGSPVRPSKAAGRWRRHGAASADDRCCAAASLIRLVFEAAGDEWSCFTPHTCPEPSSTTSYVFLRRSGVPSPSPSCVSTASKAIHRGRRSILSSCIRLTCQPISAANEPQATTRNHLLREKNNAPSCRTSMSSPDGRLLRTENGTPCRPNSVHFRRSVPWPGLTRRRGSSFNLAGRGASAKNANAIGSVHFA